MKIYVECNYLGILELNYFVGISPENFTMINKIIFFRYLLNIPTYILRNQPVLKKCITVKIRSHVSLGIIFCPITDIEISLSVIVIQLSQFHIFIAMTIFCVSSFILCLISIDFSWQVANEKRHREKRQWASSGGQLGQSTLWNDLGLPDYWRRYKGGPHGVKINGWKFEKCGTIFRFDFENTLDDIFWWNIKIIVFTLQFTIIFSHGKIRQIPHATFGPRFVAGKSPISRSYRFQLYNSGIYNDNYQ